eukprot:CAMPEP_0117529442 /NCGR_PEP_ID=MMETSP0784-20121206/37834_1 /TAXON_ID=39447 /ORGANISM="" /LENGTH=481 /DNA_ID=CAMNT_0005325763 /DNA_START=93 /DNA_END=1535 /DNA_ORIENTATION=-
MAGISLRDPVPLTEHYSRSLKDYTGLTWDTITPENSAPIIRVQNLQDAEFQDLVRQGYPFVVDDCIPLESEMVDFRCSDFGRRFPKEHMKAEYTPGQMHINLENPDWYSVPKPTVKAPMHLSRGTPISGPYVWHVKDETVDGRTKPELMNTFPVPYFLNRSALNAHEVRDSFEMWFALEGGGTQAHADAYCETTVSLQLRGRKVWRVGTYPNLSNAFEPYAYHDGEIYRSKQYWQPESEFTVEPGQCFVFPMGLIHESYVAEGNAGDDGCSVATTFQFQDPQPVYFWRNFLTRWGLSLYAKEEPCLERMEPYVFLGRRPRRRKGAEAELRQVSREIFRAADVNGDGGVSKDELFARYAKIGFRAPWTEVKDEHVLRQVSSEKAGFMAQDAVLYHDTDGDGIVSLSELEVSVLKFLAVIERTKAIKSTRKRSELLKKERAWITEHLCASGEEACQQLEHLDVATVGGDRAAAADARVNFKRT